MTSRPDPGVDTSELPDAESPDVPSIVIDEIAEDQVPRELDAAGGTPSPTGKKRPWNEKKRRFVLAFVLMGVTAGIGIGLLVAAFLAPADVWDRLDRAAILVLVPFQTLLSTAIGWYFGRSKGEK